MAARLFTRLSVVLMYNLKVFDAVEQANRMTDADQETPRRGLRFPGYYFESRKSLYVTTESRTILNEISGECAMYVQFRTDSIFDYLRNF